MFTAYYILAVSFGVIMALISLYAIKFRLKEGDDFPGKLYGPLMILGVFFAIATLGAVIHGGNEEVEHRKHEAAEKGESLSEMDKTEAEEATSQAQDKPKSEDSSNPDDPTDEN